MQKGAIFFWIPQVEYLGHAIPTDGVKTNANKIKAIEDWAIPQSMKQLRTFLGSYRLYRKFIKGYAMISMPLIDILNVGEFRWNETAQEAFVAFKRALCQAPILVGPDFSKTSIVETDASNGSIGVVLTQEGILSLSLPDP